MPYALRPMPYALCPMPYALRPMPYALRPMPYALRPHALCPLLLNPQSAMRNRITANPSTD